MILERKVNLLGYESLELKITEVYKERYRKP